MLREDDVFMAFLFILVIAFGFFSPDLEDCVMFLTHPSLPEYPHSKQIQVMCIHKHRCQSCRIYELIYNDV